MMMKTRLWFVLPPAVLYLALTENMALNNIVVALLLGLLIVWLIRPPAIALNLRQLPQSAFATLQYIVVLLVDLFISGIQVARLVLSPNPALRQGIIAVQSTPDSELGTALSTHAITLTPGEMVLENDADGMMYTHCLDAVQSATQAPQAEAKRQNLLKKITAVVKVG
ncbi:MAG: Na+/H+ antiporter subunit E [Anaerolineales bacterium]|nr:Na+/H+ antiporter subunit E [Anaerolineales bacterium]